MGAGKKRLAGDIARQATSGEVTSLKAEACDLKKVVAEQTLELRLLKKTSLRMGKIRNEGLRCTDRPSADIDAVCPFQDVEHAAQIQC